MKYIYHRGKVTKDFKENTYRALTNGLNDKNSLGIEFDVRMTKDKKVVVIHDKTISRVSDGFGLVSKKTYKELLEYNFGTKKYREKILLLDDFLKQVNSNKILLIEIKKETTIAYYANEVLKKYNYLNIYIASFDKEILNQLTYLNNNIKTGLIMWGYKKNKNTKMYKFMVLRQRSLDKEILKQLNNNKQELFIWNVLNKSKNPYNGIMILDEIL